MKTYVGVKVIEAEPCSYFDFLENHRSKAYRDTVQPDSKNRAGYLVKYPPDGYISWSPKEIFEEAYREVPAPAASSQCSFLKMFVSPDWKERARGELVYLQEKTRNLRAMLEKYKAGKLDFTPNCTFELLTQQLNAMQSYLNIVELRATFEGF